MQNNTKIHVEPKNNALLRSLLFNAIKDCLENRIGATDMILFDLDWPIKYTKEARIAITAELISSYPGRVFARQKFRCQDDRFVVVSSDGTDSSTVGVVLRPNFDLYQKELKLEHVNKLAQVHLH